MSPVNDRAFPEVKVRNDVACQSGRNGAKPLLITLHDTEGANVPKSARDLVGLGNYFDIPATEASSHVGVDEDAWSARYVNDDRKAWTQAYFNPWCLSIEMIGFARQDWNAPAKEPQLREAARWVALWHRRYGIPLRRARVTRDGRIVRPGVIQHRALGRLGGGHVDVGPDFPGARVLRLARHYVKLQEGRK